MHTELFSDPTATSPITVELDARYLDLVVQTGAAVRVELTGPDDVHDGARAALTGDRLHVVIPEISQQWSRSWRDLPRNFKSTLTVTVPDTSSLEVSFDAGSLKARGTYGRAQVRTNAGSVAIERAASVAFTGDAANLTVGVVGELNATCDAGQIKADQIDDGVVTTSAGRISVGEVTNSLTARADAGAIRVRYAGACEIDARTDLGSIRIAVAAGLAVFADCHASAGSVRTDLKQSEQPVADAPVARVRARTQLGSIKLERAAARLRA